MKDLFITIAAGFFAAMPVQPSPAVIIPADSVEASVVQYIQDHEKRSVTVDCDIPSSTVSVQEKEPLDFICLTTDTKNKEQFNTLVVLSSVEDKVNISATVSEIDEKTDPVKKTPTKAENKPAVKTSETK